MDSMKRCPSRVGLTAAGGFTLIELLIAMVVTAVMGTAMVANYVSQQQASTMVRQVAQMQQQLRGAMYVMEQDVRIAGYDPQESGLFGITNIQRWSITDLDTKPAASKEGSPSVMLTYDWSPGSPGTSEDGLLNEPMLAYRLFDETSDGILDLVRDAYDEDGNIERQLVAEGIEAIGFAYAFDNDGNGELDRTAAGNIIWAVDSDNDNLLDTNLDANDDGVIDLEDDTDGDGRITAGDSALATPVPVDRIRTVRIWLLARARSGSRGFTNQGEFVLVGDRVVPEQEGGFNDNIRRRLLVRTVDCRNAGI